MSRRPPRERPLVVHLTTTDMSLDWLLAPQLVAFRDAGYDVIGMSAPGPQVDNLAALGIPHVPVMSLVRALQPLDDLRAFREVVRRLRALRPDILHTHNPKPGVLGRIAGRLTRVPLVVNTQHGIWAQPGDRRRRRWPVYAVERIAAAFGHVELVQNPEDVTTLVDRLRVPAERVHLLGNGIDLARFDPDAVDAASRAEVRRGWGVDDDDVVCLVVGRLVREKGIVEVLGAARRLGERARFVVVGPLDTAKPDALGAPAVAAAEEHGVVFTGVRTDMPECYAAADVFVAASWREGFPRAVMEAAAMGLPTVASDVRGNRQAVVDGETGLLVPVRDADAIAQAVESLVDAADRRRELGAAARRLAHREFDQGRVIRRTLEVYETRPR